MRLTSIKLSGFKSFVDPTSVLLPANFTVVVGPNGCGKSNIIDAVRWVMGESSAGRLRGESLTDVIFSGSAARKPVSQATVELLFDNSARKVSGEFAAFDEISVKRRVDRDGNSEYFLNGSRCRKRDVTELFLGTGLGPRSYAIIEQGMISQVIDAKPEALRAHLEEAAGISLYKERRRETLSRIAQTRENLERLADLRGEVARQLEQLQQQAEQAGQYRQLQAQRQQQQGQLLALQYRHARQQWEQASQQLARRQAEVDAGVAQIHQLDAAQAEPLQQLQAAEQAQQQAVAAHYASQAEQARLEQALAHAHSLGQRQQQEQALASDGLQQLQQQLQRDAHDAAQLQDGQAGLQEQLEQATAQLEQAGQAVAQARLARQQWQQQWDQASAQLHECSRQLTRESTREESMAGQGRQLEQRLAGHDAALQQLQADHDACLLAPAEQALARAQAALEQAQQQWLQASDGRAQAEQAQQQADERLQQLRSRQQQLDGQLTALQTLQDAALGQDDPGHQAWLAGQGLADMPRLGSLLKVQPGWEAAVEAVLGPWLQALVVPRTRREQLASSWNDGQPCWLADADTDADGLPAVSADSLASRVDGPPLVRWLLARVGLPGSEGGAMDWRLDADGRLSSAHGSCHGRSDVGAGVLLRAQQVQQLQAQRVLQRAELEQAQQADNAARLALQVGRQAEQQAQQVLDRARQQQGAASAALTVLAARREGLQRELERARGTAQELLQQHQASQQQQQQLATALQQASAMQAGARQQCDALAALRQQHEDTLELAQRQLADSRERQHALVLQRETGLARHAALVQALQRGQAQQQALQAQLEQLAQGQQDSGRQQQQLEQALVQARQAAAQAASAVEQARQAHEQAQQAAAQALAHRQQRQQWLDEQREDLLQLRLQVQAAELAQQQAASLADQEQLPLEQTLAQLPADVRPAALQRQLRQLDAQLQAMGAVNLAAIEQYEQASQRHAWLQGQQTDLDGALETLETAMARIDRETRGRFKETFDKVNDGLQTLYPQLFGGGQAWLELTGSDLLDAGVSLMARPPGKKVSSLSLLSGGEKAMTAVALVFAIFQLNPAPFCLLDEVDAPLDEANVGRLAQMLRQMSEHVQFLSVSHNKATMEAADQLCGVTMREPGVSRLVSVDLSEAAQLAGTA